MIRNFIISTLAIGFALTFSAGTSKTLRPLPGVNAAKAQLKRYWKRSNPQEKILSIKSKGGATQQKSKIARGKILYKCQYPFQIKIKKGTNKKIFNVGVWYKSYGRRWMFHAVGIGSSSTEAKAGQGEPSKQELKKLLLENLKTKEDFSGYPYFADEPVTLSSYSISKGKFKKHKERFWYTYRIKLVLTDGKGKKKECGGLEFEIKKENASAEWEVSFSNAHLRCD